MVVGCREKKGMEGGEAHLVKEFQLCSGGLISGSKGIGERKGG